MCPIVRSLNRVNISFFHLCSPHSIGFIWPTSVPCCFVWVYWGALMCINRTICFGGNWRPDRLLKRACRFALCLLFLFSCESFWFSPVPQGAIQLNKQQWLCSAQGHPLLFPSLNPRSVVDTNKVFLLCTLKYTFQVSVCYCIIFIFYLQKFYFYFTTFLSIMSEFLLHYIL